MKLVDKYVEKLEEKFREKFVEFVRGVVYCRTWGNRQNKSTEQSIKKSIRKFTSQNVTQVVVY